MAPFDLSGFCPNVPPAPRARGGIIGTPCPGVSLVLHPRLFSVALFEGSLWEFGLNGVRCRSTLGYFLLPFSRALCGMKFCPIGIPRVPLSPHPGLSSTAGCGRLFEDWSLISR